MGCSPGDTRIDISAMIALTAESRLKRGDDSRPATKIVGDQAYVVKENDNVHADGDGKKADRCFCA
jgi:hypothetical protein